MEQILSTIRREDILSTIKRGHILSTIRCKHLLSTIRREHISSTIRREQMLSTIRRENILNMIGGEHILSTIKREHAFNTIRREYTLSTVSMNTHWVRHVLSTIRREHILNMVRREYTWSTIRREHMLKTIRHEYTATKWRQFQGMVWLFKDYLYQDRYQQLSGSPAETWYETSSWWKFTRSYWSRHNGVTSLKFVVRFQKDADHSPSNIANTLEDVDVVVCCGRSETIIKYPRNIHTAHHPDVRHNLVLNFDEIEWQTGVHQEGIWCTILRWCFTPLLSSRISIPTQRVIFSSPSMRMCGPCARKLASISMHGLPPSSESWVKNLMQPAPFLKTLCSAQSVPWWDLYLSQFLGSNATTPAFLPMHACCEPCFCKVDNRQGWYSSWSWQHQASSDHSLVKQDLTNIRSLLGAATWSGEHRSGSSLFESGVKNEANSFLPEDELPHFCYYLHAPEEASKSNAVMRWGHQSPLATHWDLRSSSTFMKICFHDKTIQFSSNRTTKPASADSNTKNSLAPLCPNSTYGKK